MLTAREYTMNEPLPLIKVHEAILDFCRGRRDVCVFGAQATNLHTNVPRMTQDVDIMAAEPEAFARDLAEHLRRQFPNLMAARVRAVKRAGRVLGYRVYQKRGEEAGANRHLADVRVLDVPVDELVVEGDVQYTGAKLTMAMKSAAAAVRSNLAKRLMDSADLARLMAARPEITVDTLAPLWEAIGAPAEAREVFERIRREGGLEPEVDEDSFF
jgi:hypothetical protein